MSRRDRFEHEAWLERTRLLRGCAVWGAALLVAAAAWALAALLVARAL